MTGQIRGLQLQEEMRLGQHCQQSRGVAVGSRTKRATCDTEKNQAPVVLLASGAWSGLVDHQGYSLVAVDLPRHALVSRANGQPATQNGAALVECERAAGITQREIPGVFY